MIYLILSPECCQHSLLCLYKCVTCCTFNREKWISQQQTETLATAASASYVLEGLAHKKQVFKNASYYHCCKWHCFSWAADFYGYKTMKKFIVKKYMQTQCRQTTRSQTSLKNNPEEKQVAFLSVFVSPGSEKQEKHLYFCHFPVICIRSSSKDHRNNLSNHTWWIFNRKEKTLHKLFIQSVVMKCVHVE